MGAESEGYLLVLEFRSFSKNKEHITLKKEKESFLRVGW